jgi:hypothetical protein
MRNRRNFVSGLLLTAALTAMALIAGCRAFEPEVVVVNKAPETYIIGSPLEHGGGYYHFHVFWYGSDQDGQVERFVWALTDTTVQNTDTAEDEEDTRFNPALDASHLDIGHWTTRTDSIFDFAINQGTAPSYDMTLHMVAVDDFGDFDRTPARLHFFSNTLGTPSINFFRVVDLPGEATNDTILIAPGESDTVGFGSRYHLYWEGVTPNVLGYDLDALAAVDTVYPFDDGLFGYKWQLTGPLSGGCVPSLEDCWHPRKFNEATGDSFSYFAPVNSLVFNNDGSASDPFNRFLSSGGVGVRINSLDVAGVEVAEYLRDFQFVVNYDPETILIDGETDWAHPEDPEVYPYYIMLNDPLQVHHPFTSGDRIPDRTYVVFKALAKDNENDARLNPDYGIGLTGVVTGVRTNFTGGTFSFSSGASDIDSSPTWDAGTGGWYADTLGFLTGPSTEFTFKMQAVDEHGRRDGSPPTLSFDVGYPPCVQCLEVLPNTSTPSEFGPDLECYEGGDTHPCFDGSVAEFYILGAGAIQQPERTYLNTGGITYLAIDRSTLHASFQDAAPDPEAFYSFQCNVYPIAVLMHGQDDPREAWENPLFRSMGWKYQVDYECDPYNSIKDGGGLDDILAPTWGYELGAEGIEVSATDGLWKLTVDVVVPSQLISLGSETFFTIVQFTQAGGDPVLAQTLFDICVRQISEGRVRATTMDQTQCGFRPTRPAKYHLFEQVRPPQSELSSGTWRDCFPTFTGVVSSMDLSKSAMAAHPVGSEVETSFRLVLQEGTGDFGCTPPIE